MVLGMCNIIGLKAELLELHLQGFLPDRSRIVPGILLSFHGLVLGIHRAIGELLRPETLVCKLLRVLGDLTLVEKFGSIVCIGDQRVDKFQEVGRLLDGA